MSNLPGLQPEACSQRWPGRVLGPGEACFLASRGEAQGQRQWPPCWTVAVLPETLAPLLGLSCLIQSSQAESLSTLPALRRTKLEVTFRAEALKDRAAGLVGSLEPVLSGAFQHFPFQGPLSICKVSSEPLYSREERFLLSHG